MSDAWVAPVKRPPAYRHLVEHGAKGENVRPGVRLSALKLLRGHVGDRPKKGALDRQVPCAVGAEVRSSIGTGAATIFASPKSMSFTPDFVNITLPGFRSR